MSEQLHSFVFLSLITVMEDPFPDSSCLSLVSHVHVARAHKRTCCFTCHVLPMCCHLCCALLALHAVHSGHQFLPATCHPSCSDSPTRLVSHILLLLPWCRVCVIVVSVCMGRHVSHGHVRRGWDCCVFAHDFLASVGLQSFLLKHRRTRGSSARADPASDTVRGQRRQIPTPPTWQRHGSHHNIALGLLLPRTHLVVRGSIPQRVSNWERSNMKLTVWSYFCLGPHVQR